MAFELVKLRTAQGQEYDPVPMPVLIRWHQEGRVPADAFLVDAETGEARPVIAFPGLGFAAPAGQLAPGPPTATDKLIPTRNASALAAYYCGVFGLIPCVNVLLGPAALILGFKGLRAAPETGVGAGHAWAGIVLGGLETLAGVALIIFAVAMSR